MPRKPEPAWMERVKDNAIQIHNKKGKFYDKWKQGMIGYHEREIERLKHGTTRRKEDFKPIPGKNIS